MADLNADYRIILRQALLERKAKNKAYSLRAFAKFLRRDPAYISKLLSGKVLLAVDSAATISDKLKLPEKERRLFLLSAAEEQKCHALYLIDPSLTECDPEMEAINILPRPRRVAHQQQPC